jgi:hypothetical protein
MTRLAPSRLQDYVVRGGEQVFAPPYVMGGTGLHIFIVRAGRDALSSVLDREINEPWRQAFLARGVLHRYVPTYDWVAFVFADVEHLAPDPVTLAERGGSRPSGVVANTGAAQRELVVMLPVTDKGIGPSIGETRTPNSSVFYLPFVFNDFVPSIIAGREVYGYPKEYAEFTAKGPAGRRVSRRPFFGEDPRWQQLTVSAHAPVREPTRDTKGKKAYTMKLRPYLYVDRGKTGPRTNVRRARRRRDSEPAGPRVIELFPDTGWIERASQPEPPPSVPAERTSLDELRELLNRDMEYMFLRQFRDPNQTFKASYQAIIMGGIVPNLNPEATWDAKVDKQNYLLRFPELSDGAVPNPIARSLGIRDEIQADAAVRLENLNVRVNAANIKWDRS